MERILGRQRKEKRSLPGKGQLCGLGLTAKDFEIPGRMDVRPKPHASQVNSFNSVYGTMPGNVEAHDITPAHLTIFIQTMNDSIRLLN